MFFPPCLTWLSLIRILFGPPARLYQATTLLFVAVWSLAFILLCCEFSSFLCSFKVLQECNLLIQEFLIQQIKMLLKSSTLRHKAPILESLLTHLDPLDLSVTIEPLGLDLSALSMVKYEVVFSSMSIVLFLPVASISYVHRTSIWSWFKVWSVPLGVLYVLHTWVLGFDGFILLVFPVELGISPIDGVLACIIALRVYVYLYNNYFNAYFDSHMDMWGQIFWRVYCVYQVYEDSHSYVLTFFALLCIVP